MLLREAFVLVGPTASGKSDVGHLLAERMQGAILSADSMLVYKGMDIGTAKPPASSRGSIPYLGIDLISPEQDFDVWRYLQLVGDQVAALPADKPVLVVGGSGLYVKALTQGLDPHIAAPVERERWEQVYAEHGVAGLQAILQERDPTALHALSDPHNPRRLIRAIEQMVAKESRVAAPSNEVQRNWACDTYASPFAGLLPDNMPLRARIADRVEKMYAVGLLREARKLREAYPLLSNTASQAIGYREAFALLDGVLDVTAAQERTIIRTNRLAKRQRTWFRHQARVEWLAPGPEQDVEHLASEVEKIWRKYGPIQLRLP